MHTLVVLVVAFAILAGCALFGRLLRGPAGLRTALLLFVPVWFLGAAYNMYVGVSQAGYGVADEAPMFVLVFGVPTAIALLLRWRLTRSSQA